MSFASDLSGFADKATLRVDRIRRAVVINLFSAIIEDTPVLSGRLRGNWQASVGSPLLDEIPTRGGSTPQGQVPPECADEVVGIADGINGNDKTAYLRNNLPYAARVEFDGWSHTKAPAGMIRKNVARVTQLINKAMREGKV